MPTVELDPPRAERDRAPRDRGGAAAGRGYAAAVQPVGAHTVETDAAGLTAGAVTIPVGAFAMPAYRALPAGGDAAKRPVVLVVSEIFGVHAHIADVTRRFAKLGYLAIAPELFVRQGDAKAHADVATLIAEVVGKVPDAQALGDLDACVAWAAANGGDTSRLGVTGFCWGGRITWLYAAHNPAVKAAVAWYGQLLGAPSALKPANPVDVADRLLAPVLGLYGGADAGIPLDAVERMKAVLAASANPAAKGSEFVVYADAPHAFHADYRPSYRADAAADGWSRCVAWLAAHGVG